MIINKEVLLKYRKLLSSNPKDLSLVKEFLKLLNISINDEEFISCSTPTMKEEVNNTEVPCIVISSQKWELEINILDDRFFLNRSWNNDEYQFVKQYLYDNNYLKEETYTLSIDDLTFIGLRESLSTKALCLYTDLKSVVRTHQNSAIMNPLDESIIRIKTFTNDVETEDSNYYNEVVYFEEDEELYDVTINKTVDSVFLGGATLSFPDYRLEMKKDKELEMIYDEIGILYVEDDKSYPLPTIACMGKYLKDGQNKDYIIRIKKDSDILRIEITDETGSKFYRCPNRDVGPISIQDLELIIENLSEILKDKEYKNSIIDYIEEIQHKLDNRQNYDFNDMCYYNRDSFDQIITGEWQPLVDNLPPRDNPNNKKPYSLEEKGFALYSKKEELLELLSEIEAPYLDIRGQMSI